MSGRLAGYAAEIERYLRGATGVKREELDDDKSATSARREAGEFQAMKGYERTGGGGGLGQGRAGSVVSAGRNPPRSSPGVTGVAGSAMPSRASTSAAAASSPKAASAPIMVYGATLAGFRPEEEEEDWKRRGGGGGGRGAGRASGTGRAARVAYQARAVAARAGYVLISAES